MITTRPSPIEYKGLNFLIMDAPDNSTIHLYIKEMKKHNVTTLVRTCEPTYSETKLTQEDIDPHDLAFPDGLEPPDSIISTWLELVTKVFNVRKGVPDNTDRCIAIHCVAGLGRAPIMVIIALIEAGMDNMDAVDFVRRARRGAINHRQLQFLTKYKRKGVWKKAQSCCTIF
mmetsp:Transcript_43381/g.49898  ORF Transcript_43381/g.49898 Transcript_43381/m.49898 type:complete len:172 (+) Transcript_43381:118-633(+)